ncbi:hypothetical protein ACIBCO_36990 [Streptomyces violascens]|uniref:hypothetical protein n=1 Tax=Streptomyces violascens TaxID=67381 RepID=UPI003798B8A4
MIKAWLVDETTAQLSAVELSDADAGAQYEELRRVVGGGTDAAYYHRSAVMHVHGTSSRDGMRPNLAAWALACCWRNMELPYLLHGPIVITGPYNADGATVGELSTQLTSQVHTVCATVRETVDAWQLRPPASNEAAIAELLAYTRRDLSAVN